MGERSEQELTDYARINGLAPVPRHLDGTPPEEVEATFDASRLANPTSLSKQIPAGDPDRRRLQAKLDKLEQRTASQLPLARPPQGREQAVAHLHALEEQADADLAIYEKTASGLKQAMVAAALQLKDISVMEPATSMAESATGLFRISAWTGLAGFFAGLVFVSTRDRMSNKLNQPEQVAAALNTVALGGIPIDQSNQPKEYDRQKQEPALRLDFHSDVLTADAFRSIKRALLQRLNDDLASRYLIFSAAGKGAGTTFVVSNLAATLASPNRRVLLVDGNLMKPGLHAIFGAGNEAGFADLLQPHSTVPAKAVIRKTQIPNLYLLPAGPAAFNTSKLLLSNRVPHVLRDFTRDFDLILVDAPAMNLDTRNLAKSSDGVVLIVKANVTDRESASIAREAISSGGTLVIGAILTNWDAAKS